MLALVLAALGPAAAASVAATRPALATVQPDLDAGECEGGHGVSLADPLSGGEQEIPSNAVTTLAGDATLVAFSSFAPARGDVVLDAIGGGCAPDPGFGAGGSATIAIPSGLEPAQREPHGPEGLAIDVVEATSGGGAIIAGSWRGAWVAAELTSTGQLDTAFGQRGWSVLPFRGEVTAAIQEPGGRFLIAGSEDLSGCCTRNWAAALTAGGQLDGGFGAHGRVALPTGEDAAVKRLVLEGDGDLLVAVGHGNMGCWGISLETLTPAGRPVPRFASRLESFWRRLGFHAFVGDVYAEGNGFALAGSGQRPCYEPGRTPAPHPTGVLARFRAGGEPLGAPVRFRSAMYGSVEALPARGDTFLAESFYGRPRALTITARRRNGSIDPAFGSDGRVAVDVPASSEEVPLTTLSVLPAGAGGVLVVAERRGSVELIPLRL